MFTTFYPLKVTFSEENMIRNIQYEVSRTAAILFYHIKHHNTV